MGTITIEVGVKSQSYERVVSNWRGDRNKYFDRMADDGLASGFDRIIVVSGWVDDDGVLLLKEGECSVEDGKYGLHPQMHHYLDEAIKRYGEAYVEKCAVILKAVPSDKWDQHQAMRGNGSKDTTTDSRTPSLPTTREISKLI